MSIDQQLRDTVPTHLPPLDHADLQRRGRGRRWTTRAATGLATVGAVAAVAGVAVSLRPATVDVTGPGGAATAAPSPSHSPDAIAAADAQVLDAWGDLSHDQAVTDLHEVLDEHPARPDGLESIEVMGFADGGEITTVPHGTTDFPVIDVSDDEFVADGRFETPALLPTWTQQAARNALDSLAATDLFEYGGVAVDPRGRTVLEFQANFVDQQIWIDPASGYTVGARFGDAMRASDEEIADDQTRHEDPGGAATTHPAGS